MDYFADFGKPNLLDGIKLIKIVLNCKNNDGFLIAINFFFKGTKNYSFKKFGIKPEIQEVISLESHR